MISAPAPEVSSVAEGRASRRVSIESAILKRSDRRRIATSRRPIFRPRYIIAVQMGADADSAKLVRRTTMAAAGLVVAIVLAAVAVWLRRPRLETIEVSQQTTYLVTPTRADGWVDY